MDGLRRIGRSLADSSMQAYVAFLCILSGLPIFFTHNLAPSSLSAELPFPLVMVWAVVLVLGGVMKLVGIALPSVRIEQGGVALLGGGAAVYMVCLVGFISAGGWVVLLTYGFFTLAAYTRYRFLGEVQKGIRHAQEIKLRE